MECTVLEILRGDRSYGPHIWLKLRIEPRGPELLAGVDAPARAAQPQGGVDGGEQLEPGVEDAHDHERTDVRIRSGRTQVIRVDRHVARS